MNTPAQPPMHPMIAAAQRLGGDHVLRQGSLAREASRMVVEAQLGAAYHEGELVLAALDYPFPERGKAQGSHASLLLTDRRLFGSMVASNIRDTTVDIPLASVTGAREEGGLLSSGVVVSTHAGEVRVPLWSKELSSYFRDVLGVPAPHRSLGPLQLAATPGDPIGAHAAAWYITSGSPVTAAMPRLAFEAARQGKLSEQAAQAILLRAVLLDRTLVTGRGMHAGQWLSTLPRPALVALLAAALGQPAGSMGDAGWERHDFALSPGGRSAGAAAASSALGLASAALLGVGWVSLPGGGLGFSHLRATVVDFPCGSGFRLDAANGPHAFKLPFSGSPLVTSLFGLLAKVETRRLLAEIALGSVVPPEQLASVPKAALEAAAAALGCPLQLGE